jgi:aquaporin Z
MFDPKALAAEIIGTFWLVLGGCGAAVLAADFGTGANGTSLGIGFLGVAFAFGFAVLTGAYAVGHVSGGHFNPAVTIGLVVGGRFEAVKAIGYVIAQVIGATIAAGTIYLIASGSAGWEIGDGAGAFASNGYGDLSPGGSPCLCLSGRGRADRSVPHRHPGRNGQAPPPAWAGWPSA